MGDDFSRLGEDAVTVTRRAPDEPLRPLGRSRSLQVYRQAAREWAQAHGQRVSEARRDTAFKDNYTRFRELYAQRDRLHEDRSPEGKQRWRQFAQDYGQAMDALALPEDREWRRELFGS